MNDYIELDGFKYRTAADNWEPNEERPMVIRRLMSGNTNVTFGPATFTGWRGIVLVPTQTAAPGFGDVENLRTTYRKRSVLSFADHYGNDFNVVIDRSVGEKSISPMWTAVDNVFRINLSRVKI